jgi:antitoxin component YwqK of YwqJK toxin-antitoxin module
MSLQEDLFQNNCDLWAQFNPKEALLLPYLQKNDLTFCSTQNGELNLVKDEAEKKHHFHSNKNASVEAEEWFSKLDLEKVFVVCIYGIGLGYYYDAIRPWLKKDSARRLVFLEDDLMVMQRFLETPKATEILKDPQIQVLYFKDLNDTDAVLEVLYWNFAMTRLIVSVLNHYAVEKKENFASLHQKITYDFAVKNALVEEYLKFGGAFFINFYQNILNLPGSFLGNKTFGSFHNVPAIICGAGPSLVKSLPILSELGDKALIFAGGSALNAFNAGGIQPHLGAGIDPNPAQLDRLINNQAYEVPFYYRNRLYHEAFKMIHGPRLYVTGCGGYDVSDWFEEKLKIKSEFLDEGHNVINFCLQIAQQLGCNPIIFAGMDLGFSDMKTYAPGIEEAIDFDPTKALDEEDYDSKPILRKDIQGNPLYTLWKWVAESEWIGDFAKEHLDLTIINCTEGGLGFPGIANETLEETVEHYLTRQYAILDRLNGEIQNSAMPQATLPKITKMTKELQESLCRCLKHLTVLIEEAQNLHSRIKNEKKITDVLQSGYAALCEIELAEEPGYQYVLDIFNAVQSRILNRELHESRSGTELNSLLRKFEINIKRLTFLRDVAKFNVEVMEYSLNEKKKEKRKKQPIDFSSLLEKPMSETKCPDFHPRMLPSNPEEGQTVDGEYLVRTLKQYGKPAEECRIEKDCILEGQCLLYYPDGVLKAETFYMNDKLHGPSTYFSPRGIVLSKSFYTEGSLNGESRWYDISGRLYAIRNYHRGKLHGIQKYYYPNGNPKTIMEYSYGKIQGKVLLYYPEGGIKREILN